MKNNDLKSVLTDIVEEALPSSDIDLLPTLTRKLAAQKPKNKMFLRLFAQGSLLRRALLTVLALALAFTVLLITPQGRAWAQEVFQFFKRTNSTTIQLSENELKRMEIADEPYDLPLVPVSIPTLSPEMAVVPGCETPQKSQSYRCQVALAESQLGFDLKELPAKPEDWEFEFLHFDTASKTATLGYAFDFSYMSYSTLYFTQGLGDFPEFYQNNPWEVVPANKVEIVKVGDYNGEYVKGSFSVPTGSSNLEWSEDHLKRLAWSDGTKWYLIKLWRNLNLLDTMGREQLIELAEGLVDSPLEKAEPLNPDFLYSISDAERVSGFDLKAPTVLPMEMSFSYARYYPDNQEVRLFYGLNNDLVIYQWKGKSLDFDTLSTTSNPDYEIVEVNGEKAFYGSAKGADTYLFLWWQKDGLYYQMYYYEYIGAKLDKEKMIAIAESMQDIDDFRTKDHKPYEYVSIYEQTLGFDAEEFPTTPTRWSFANVWADPRARCIALVYTSTTEPGSLFISQCRTDKYFDISGFPAKSIERAGIGSNQGQYVVGNFVTGDNGKSIWDPASPLKQLYWQEDGLWIQVSLSGNSTVVYDKEELISMAESLR